MKFWQKLYTIYTGLVFIIMFLLLFPLFFVIVQNKPWHKFSYHINKIWAKVFFKVIIKPVQIDIHPKIDKSKVYIFCPNHFSYLDIPSMGFAPNNFVFVGKSAIKKAPLFGYMFDRLHIAVNRQSRKSSYDTYLRSTEVIKEGRSLAIFPEGGIISQNPPAMARFKDGAFRIAIEQQIPIIPVTIPNNWIILPDQKELLLKKGILKVAFHEPIETVGMNVSDIKSLKEKVRSEMEKHLKSKIEYAS